MYLSLRQASATINGRRKALQVAAAAVAWAAAPVASADSTLLGRPRVQVGPRGTIRSIGEAARRARGGELIEIDAGEYHADTAVWTQDDLEIRAVGGRVRLLAEGSAAEGKAIWVVRGGRIAVSGFDFIGARVPSGNGAGIRFEAGSLLLQNCRFLDNEMGLLSASRHEMQLVVRHCGFGDAPRHDSGQLHHLLYVGAIDACEVAHCHFHNGWRGHLFKSRARANRLLDNRFVDAPAGAASYEVEFPDGGDNIVIGNRIEQSASTQNPVMLSVGAEAGGRHGTRLLLRRNHFVNHFTGGTDAQPRFVQLWGDRLSSLEIDAADNIFDGPGLIGLHP